MSVTIPVNARPKAMDLGGTFAVVWMGRAVILTPTMSKAITLSKHFNGFLRRLQPANHLYQTLLAQSWVDYLGLASQAGNGFQPILPVS